jgi:thiol:disulfide interchange protein
MGLPWPFAGGGLSFLPKPGVWMTRVKYVFGVFIVLFAIYYGYLGFSLLFPPAHADYSGKNSEVILVDALKQAQKENEPVFIDFWASWCKNCTTMEKTTFKNKDVINKLEHYIIVKFQAERPDAENIKKILDHYGVLGLPTYIILQPVQK